MSRLWQGEDNVSENKSTGQLKLTKRRLQSLTRQKWHKLRGAKPPDTEDAVEFQNKTGRRGGDQWPFTKTGNRFISTLARCQTFWFGVRMKRGLTSRDWKCFARQQCVLTTAHFFGFCFVLVLPCGSRHSGWMDETWRVECGRGQNKETPPLDFLAGRLLCRNQLKCPCTSKNCMIFIGIIKSSSSTRCAQCKVQLLPLF